VRPEDSRILCNCTSAVLETGLQGVKPCFLQVYYRTPGGKDEQCRWTIQTTSLQRWLPTAYRTMVGDSYSHSLCTVQWPTSQIRGNPGLWLIARWCKMHNCWHSNDRIPWHGEGRWTWWTCRRAMESHVGNSDLQREDIHTGGHFTPQYNDKSSSRLPIIRSFRSSLTSWTSI